ncbi:uncharacterized protein LOC132554913 [Ylistrum balloti]|uniref:uncharacterized protein LOC132554913 n=1 Tax=Ylistrum balloti TaxID=509963 RepID=UPI002905E70C|nr:uncharacterized protein LOC132554913 [Ylistrum balloti]
MIVTLKFCVAVICAWTVTGHPAKWSQTNQLSEKEYQLENIAFSPDNFDGMDKQGMIWSGFGQSRPGKDFVYNIVENSDRRGTRQKRAVRKSTEPLKKSHRGKGTSRHSGTTSRKDERKQSVHNRPNMLPDHTNDEMFKQSLRHVLILGSKKPAPTGKQKTPKRSNRGSFSIVPDKPKPRRYPLRQGWRSRIRSRGRARSRSASRKSKQKRVIRKTVRRGFVVLD